MDSYTPKVKQIFEYLLAVKKMNEKIIRSVKEYEKVWWQFDFPNIDGCYFNGNGQVDNAWLEVHKQVIPPTPALPILLHQWVKTWNNPEKEPLVEEKILHSESEEAFEDNAERVDVFKKWIKEEWRPWAAEAKPKREIQKIYMDLFTLHQRFQREGEGIELVWGHGMLSWNTQKDFIQRPLLVTKLELQFDAKQGIITMIPTSKGTVMETDMLNNLEIPNIQRIEQMGRELSATDFDLWDEDSIAPLLKEFVHTISSEGIYKGEELPDGKPTNPVIRYSPHIILRSSNGRIWEKELKDILEKLDDGIPVPQTIKLLTTEEQVITKDSTSESSDNSWSSVGEDLLFPLPSNFEQKMIAQKLATSPGVIVQGPPGTGKSHTIVNLISHLLAHGKRVLVTSEKERALQVLRDKIPEDIRALCVSLLGGDSKSVKELEDSVKSIAENMDRLDPRVLSKKIESRKTELYETRKIIAKLQTEINRAAEKENEILIVDGVEHTPLEIGKWLSDKIKHNWFPDQLSLGIEFPITDEEFKTLILKLETLAKNDIEQLESVRPKTSDIWSPSELEEMVKQFNITQRNVSENIHSIKDWNVPEEFKDFSSLAQQITEAIKKLEQLQEPWHQTILQEVTMNENKVLEWNDFITECKERTERLNQLEKELIEVEIHFLEEFNLVTTKEDLQELLTKLQSSKGLNWIFKNVTGRKFGYLFNGPKVDGLNIRNSNDVETLLKHIEVQEIKNKLTLKWNRTMQEIDGDTIDQKMNRFSHHVVSQLSKIQTLVDWKTETVHSLQELVKSIGVPDPYKWTDLDWFNEVSHGIKTLEDVKKLEEIQQKINQTSSFLNFGKDVSNAHSSWIQLKNACDQKDVERYTDLFLALNRLEGMEQEYQTFKETIEKLKAVSPKWVYHLLELGGYGNPVIVSDDWKDAWKWSQLNHWLEMHQKNTDIEQKERDLELARKTESRNIRELVAESTWLAQIERTTRKQKSSLHAWLNAIKRIGKGTGKYANMYRKEASEEMNTCRGAIPVWIMPIQKVIENIQLSDDLFDVVIVDESSQSNLFSLSALLRGKKVVIVGDDNQISPESVGQDIGEVKQLIDRFLHNIPHKNRFEMKTSLYDITSQVFDSKIPLKEHFRCVPEIIQFSNDLMYGGQMDPLRLPLGNEKITPPVKAVRVEDGFRMEHTTKTINRPEAESLVEYISELSKDPQYNNKSFGVISLQGHDQARLIEDLLRETIGEEEMIERKIVCGDSYSFQGDERDIIFLSMVAATNVRIGALMKRSDMQRFNVAASRARDQMILFHSVDLKDLNPGCVRYSLLQYCLEPNRVQLELNEVEHEFDSEFEKDVFKLVAARGYRIVPQVKVGTLGKKIDLVVEGMRSRLAIECDGDKWHGLDKWNEDIERQRILERVGWTFWRVRGSAFYRDPVTAMESLWVKLDAMGIKPVGAIEKQEEEKTIINNNDEQTEKLVNVEIKDEFISKETDPIKPPLHEQSNKPNQSFQQLSIENLEDSEFEITSFLVSSGLQMVDKRSSGGSLWVVGGEELSPIMNDLTAKGYKFTFAKNGGRATKKSASWYLLNNK
ncbi:AAA domain-containing protein [Fictibacillus phosphorivorans]|uniref:AAA domain-containing protein n=1 Tax=Fictibacillus phosphorivorans TaxID=1221500 RepID=UPI003CF0D0A5